MRAESEERLPTEQPDSAEPAGEQDAGNEAEREAQTQRSDGEKDAEANASASEASDLAAERDRYLDLAQRTQADFENYRKRAAKEAASAGERAKAGLVRELLPVVDNLERALASAPEGDPLLDGVRLVHVDLIGVLERAGVKAFDPAGDEFDPTVHEALSTRPAADGEGSGVVVDVVEKGYRLNESVLRPARVIVSA